MAAPGLQAFVSAGLSNGHLPPEGGFARPAVVGLGSLRPDQACLALRPLYHDAIAGYSVRRHPPYNL